MKKRRKISAALGPLSQKVLAGLQKAATAKVVDLNTFKASKDHAEALDKTIISDKELRRLDPLHALYAYAQNKASIFVEQLGDLPFLEKLSNGLADAQDLYLPSGPPMSPLTKSYFTFWAFFDFCVGLKRETFGTIIIDVCKMMDVDQTLIELFENMQKSRMGFYLHQGRSGKHVHLRELLTNKVHRAIVPSGHKGVPGEMWYARIMPGTVAWMDLDYDLVVTTPYVIGEYGPNTFFHGNERKWLEFFDRNLSRSNMPDRVSAYKFIMKYGLGKNYWNEYIFEAYVNHSKEYVLLAGFPDIPSSRPHSKESEDLI